VADVQLVVVGSIGIDTIGTPTAKREDVLGGSVSYACAAASYFTSVGMVGVVGNDFPDASMALYRQFGIDLEGLQVVPGETFRWSGVYHDDMNNRDTISTDLNVFADFSPDLPEAYRATPYVLLGNISPDLQLHVLDQIKNPQFIMADSMDLWINVARDDLMKVISRVDLLTLNDSEARLLTGEANAVKAARALLELGPRYVVLKKGEHGALLFTQDTVVMAPAFPLDHFEDPTGAGDCFAGGFMGALARARRHDTVDLREALLYGSVVASFGVEQFGLDRLAKLTAEQIDERFGLLGEMIDPA
tara:strand:+ start:150 stop:1061 length:912 start_codon:yes stop_codon:yes gene_type:complete